MDKQTHKKLLLSGLNEFFYYNQYDEDRFPTFRSLDRHEEVDFDGNKYYYYVAFDD